MRETKLVQRLSSSDPTRGTKIVCKALIDAGAAVNGSRSQMIGGYSPLHVAAAIGSTDCLQELVDAGASLRHSASELAYRVVLPQHWSWQKMLTATDSLNTSERLYQRVRQVRFMGRTH